jgi:hypothetical protein
MTLTCRQCGAELLPETSFCRQCGTAITPNQSPGVNDRTTKLFDETDIVATQRLDPRPTSPERAGLNLPTVAKVEAHQRTSNKVVLITTVLVLLIAGILSTLAIVKKRGDRRAPSADALSYPGARKFMDVVSEGGGRAVHIETSDPLDEVQEWYREKLQPEKVVRLTSGSVVMKNEKTTATIVSEDNRTNILLKILP